MIQLSRLRSGSVLIGFLAALVLMLLAGSCAPKPTTFEQDFWEKTYGGDWTRIPLFEHYDIRTLVGLHHGNIWKIVACADKDDVFFFSKGVSIDSVSSFSFRPEAGVFWAETKHSSTRAFIVVKGDMPTTWTQVLQAIPGTNIRTDSSAGCVKIRFSKSENLHKAIVKLGFEDTEMLVPDDMLTLGGGPIGDRRRYKAYPWYPPKYDNRTDAERAADLGKPYSITWDGKPPSAVPPTDSGSPSPPQ